MLSLRGAGYAAAWAPLLDSHGSLFPADVMGDIQRGLTQPPPALAAAERLRADLYRRLLAFLGEHDFLITPSAPVLPFPVDILWPREIDGVAQQTYVDWLAITAIPSLLACPVLAMPAGFSAEGLPFGVQIIGRPRSEARLFRAAAWIERHLGLKPAVIEPKHAPLATR
jgi:amidase